MSISHCRLCHCDQFSPFLDLGMLAPCGVFPESPDRDPPKAPLNAVRCRECGLVQLADDLPPEVTFTGGFGYRSGTNPSMRAHLGRLATRLADLEDGALVIDIGSNDGTFLAALRPDLKKVGVDPVAYGMLDHYPLAATIHGEFWDATLAAVYQGQAQAITCFACLYDMPNPNAFMANVARALAPGGVFLCEVVGLPGIMMTGAFDMLSHEHLAFHSWSTLDRLMRNHGLAIHWPGACITKTNGGSMLFEARKVEGEIRPLPVSARLGEDATEDADFARKVAETILQVRSFVWWANNQGKLVHGLCASTRGNVILQACGLSERDIPCISDKSEHKWGRLTPGTLIPIVSEEWSRAQRPDYYLNLGWHYPNIKAEEAEFLARGGKLVNPLPHALQVVGA